MITKHVGRLSNISSFGFDIDGVFTNCNIYFSNSGDAFKSFNVKDGYAVTTAIKHHYNIFIISGGRGESSKFRLNGLGVEDIFLGVEDKAEVFSTYIKEKNIKAENVLYMGDDMPDLPVLKQVGFACCPADAIEEVKEVVHFVSQYKGGGGAVREVIEAVLKARNHWDTF